MILFRPPRGGRKQKIHTPSRCLTHKPARPRAVTCLHAEPYPIVFDEFPSKGHTQTDEPVLGYNESPVLKLLPSRVASWLLASRTKRAKLGIFRVTLPKSKSTVPTRHPLEES